MVHCFEGPLFLVGSRHFASSSAGINLNFSLALDVATWLKFFNDDNKPDEKLISLQCLLNVLILRLSLFPLRIQNGGRQFDKSTCRIWSQIWRRSGLNGTSSTSLWSPSCHRCCKLLLLSLLLMMLFSSLLLMLNSMML